MKKIILLLSFISTLAFAVDKQVIAPSGSVIVKGNTTVKMQTYNTGAWQDRLTILNDGKIGMGTSPSTELDVLGTIKASTGFKISTASNSLTMYDNGSLTVTFTMNNSGNTSGSKTIYWERIGYTINIFIPSFVVSANGTDIIMETGSVLPSSIRPTTEHRMNPYVSYNNGVVIESPGHVRVTTAGSIVLARDNILTPWTSASNSAGPGGGAFIITYMLH